MSIEKQRPRFAPPFGYSVQRENFLPTITVLLLMSLRITATMSLTLHQNRLVLVLVLLSVLVPHLSKSQLDEEWEPTSDWYTKYPKYPGYCSTPEQMESRFIPPLKGDLGDSRLVHVTSVIRHGARTALGRSPDNQCWDGYWDNPETAVWDCRLTELVAPPSTERILEEEYNQGGYENSLSAQFLYEKVFDALNSGGDSNILNGTCQEGQLILQGYDQLMSNGVLLRETYLFDGTMYGHDEKMRLIDISPSSWKLPWDEGNLYLRSDDSHKTLMSAQVLLRGMLGDELKHQVAEDFPTLPIHTADHSRDILGGFQEHCPRLDAIRQAAESSKEYVKFYNTQESQEVRDFMNSQLVHDHGLFDCLMTTVCTDRPLPVRFGIYNPSPKSWFNRIAAYHTTNHSFHLRYNDSEYSKLSMGPLWAEILDNFAPLRAVDGSFDSEPPTAKLAIYSGYDSTIMQLLSTLGPNVWNGTEWPPYASMMLIELHELVDGFDAAYFESNYAFRLVYNGKVLTSEVEGCPKDMELCDFQTLFERLKPFAKRSIDCVDPNAGIENGVEIAKSILSTTAGVFLAVVVVLLSGLLGATGAFFYLTGTLPTKEIVKATAVDLGSTSLSLGSRRNRSSVVEDRSTRLSHSSRQGRGSVVGDHVEASMSDAATYFDDDE